MDFRTFKSYRLPDQPIQNLELFAQAWHECAELQCSALDEWIGRSLLSLQQLERFEIGVYADGKTIGGLILAPDPWDPHVGPCMSVFAQYVLPEYRNSGVSLRCMREAIRTCREAGHTVLAYTHRTAPWRYETTYRRIH